jgi:acetyltransferase-like isoleucine patch superfamily enzyme
MLYQAKKRIKRLLGNLSAVLSGLFSKTILYSIWFNLRYLLWKQAKHIPVIIYDSKVYGKPKIVLDVTHVTRGMIRIGRQGKNTWNGNDHSSLTFWGGGRIVFKGSARLTRSVHLRVLEDGVLEIGDSFYTSSNLNLHCAESVVIGDNVTFGWDIMLMDTDYHKYWLEEKNRLAEHKKNIHIGSNCWIGSKTIITKGTHIEDHTIVGAGSVVSGTFAKSNVIIKGNPAKIIREGVRIKEDLFW